MANIPCFMIEPVGRIQTRLGIYEPGDCPLFKGAGMPEHSAQYEFDTDLQGWEPGGVIEYPPASLTDERFPKACPCGYIFTDAAQRYSGQGHYWRDTRDGTTFFRDAFNAPAGAMFYVTWYKSNGAWNWKGPDGKTLAVVTPGGVWIIDSRASNCTMPDDNEHRCWVRHGEPPLVTVDKNGLTCGAGAGSIQAGSYHGFLRNGELTDC